MRALLFRSDMAAATRGEYALLGALVALVVAASGTKLGVAVLASLEHGAAARLLGFD